MKYAITDIALFDAIHLFINIALPHQNSRDYVTVAALNQVPYRQRPLADLGCLQFKLVAKVNNNRLEWELSRYFELDLDRNFAALVVRCNYLLG